MKIRDFFSAVERAPYVTLKLGRLQRRGNTWNETRVDVQIATDMLSMSYHNAYDITILITGDGDYAPMVEEVKRLGKLVENAYFEKGSSAHFQKACDRFILLTSELIENCFVYQKILNFRTKAFPNLPLKSE